MTIFSNPVLADLAARLLGTASSLAPKMRRLYSDVACETGSVTVETRHGTVGCTVYRPPLEEGEVPPVYVNVHGGGFVIRFPGQDDAWCRYLATEAKVVVLNVDYTTAPRGRFPLPVEQVYDVLRWASREERDWDGSRLCVGGQSAGGSLTAGAARLALREGGPRIALQVLHYPVLDLVTPRESKRRPEHKTPVRPWMGDVFETAYMPDVGLRRDPLASPAWGPNADDIENIAPALVVTAARDTLRDEGAAYAEKLAAAGSLVEHHDVPDVGHGYDILGESTEATRETYALIVRHVVAATKTSASG
jgi:acetyl esterase